MKKLFKKRYLVIAIILILIVGGYFLFGKKQKTGSVSTAVQKGTINEEIILTGQVAADKHVKLYFPAPGKISWVGVKEGQQVYKGQALVSIDKTTLNTTYQQALNNYRSYQAAAESALDSVKGHSGDETFAQKSTRTTAEVARDNAYDAVTAAEYNLRNATLYAPFAGMVTSLPFPSPGVNILMTDVQVELLDPSSIYFDVDADQSEVVSIKENQEVVVTLDSYREQEFSGAVSFVGYTPKANETGTVYKVRVNLKNGENKVYPKVGMTGDAKFIISQKENVLYVPIEFVHSDKDGKYVDLGKIGNKVRVTTGIENESQIEITSGVKEGDLLYD